MSVLCAALLALSGVASAATTADVTGPRPLGYIVIPDLRATLARVETVASVVTPGSVPPGALAAGLAAKLKDPGLAGLGRGPLVVLFLAGPSPAGPPAVAVFVPVSDPAPYETALSALGWQVRRAAGFVVGSSVAVPVLDDEYLRIDEEPLTGDLRVSLNAVDIMDTYGPMIHAGLGTLTAGLAAKAPADATPSRPSPAAAGKILQLEVKTFLLLLEQAESLAVEVRLQPDAVVSETQIAARPGSALAELAMQPPAGANGASALLSRPGFMAASYQMDGARLAAFAVSLVRAAAGDPQTAALATPDLLALLAQMGRAFTGEAAAGLRAGSGAPLVAETVMRVRDEAAALGFMEKSAALLAPGGAWHALYADLGVPLRVALQKDVRSRAGVTVHRFRMTLEGTGLSAEQRSQYALFMRDTEFAIARGYFLSAQDPAALDALIDRATTRAPQVALPLQAVSEFGEGAQVYVDYDVFGLMRSVFAALPPATGTPNPFVTLPPTDAHPLTYAAWLADGRIRLQAKVPLRPFALMVESFKKNAPSKITPGDNTPR